MNDASAFTKLVPGFDFLQGLARNAGAALPGIGQWVAPTMDPAEIEKRIGELRTVQFWLEQNARMLATTIQALEVQKMTLSTLQTMNVQMGDLRESLKLKPAAPQGVAPAGGRGTKAPATPGVVDPTQWWSALTSQFTQLAASAMKDGATDAARSMAGSVLKQGMDSATATFKAAAGAPAKMASAAGSAALDAAGAAGKALRRPKAAARKRAPAKR